MEKRFEKIRIDLRPFGYGIRDVGVIWPEEHECKCEDGPDAGQGGGMDEDDEDDGQGEDPGAVTSPAMEEEADDNAGADTGAEDGGGDV